MDQVYFGIEATLTYPTLCWKGTCISPEIRVWYLPLELYLKSGH